MIRRWQSFSRLVLGLLVLAVMCSAAVWFFMRGSENPQPETRAAVRLLWTFEPPQRGGIMSSPLVDGDRVVVAVIADNPFAPRGSLFCLDRHTRQVLWKYDDNQRMLPVYSSPCLADGRLYI